MPLRYWLFFVIAGALTYFLLSVADQEISAGVDRLSELRTVHPSVPDMDPDLKRVSARSPYMRNER